MTSLEIFDRLIRELHPTEAEVRQKQEALSKHVEEVQAAVKARLTSPGGLDDLIAQERTPFVGSKVISNFGERNEEAWYPCYVPPQGTRFGDTVRRIPGGFYTFHSPRGELRGVSEMAVFSPREITSFREELQGAVAKARAAR